MFSLKRSPMGIGGCTLNGALCALQHVGKPGLRQQAAAVAAGRPVNTQTDGYASIQQLTNLKERYTLVCEE